jgi:hypothetical protein
MTIANLVVELEVDASSFNKTMGEVARAHETLANQLTDVSAFRDFASAMESVAAQSDEVSRGVKKLNDESEAASVALDILSIGLMVFAPEAEAAAGVVAGLSLALDTYHLLAQDASGNTKTLRDQLVGLASQTPEALQRRLQQLQAAAPQVFADETRKADELKAHLAWLNDPTLGGGAAHFLSLGKGWNAWREEIANTTTALENQQVLVNGLTQVMADLAGPIRLKPVTVVAEGSGRVSDIKPAAEPPLALRGVDPAHIQLATETRAAVESPVQNNLKKALDDVVESAGKVEEVVSVVGDMHNAIVSLAGPSAEKFFGPFRIIAKLLAGFEIAEGIAKLASGIWPPNPTALAAAAQHFKAAQQFAQIGGGGGGGGGGIAQSSFFQGGDLRPGAQAGPGTLTVVFPQGGSVLDPNNPDHQNAFVDFLRTITERNIVVVPGT